MKIARGRRARGAAVAALLASLLAGSSASAGEKQFGYVYEPQTLPPGQVELEQWVTARAGKAAGHFVRFDLRTEIEVGIVEDLQTALYLNLESVRAVDARTGPRGQSDFLAKDGKTSFTELEFRGVSNEWIWKLSDPVAEPVGLALYFEWTTDGGELELEEKLIASKTWDGFTLAANLKVEQEWKLEPGEHGRELKCEVDIGIAFKIPDTFLTVGLEFRNVNVLEKMTEYEHSVFQLGPVFHAGVGRWWATLTLFPQIASATPTYRWFDYEEFEAFEGRLIVGVEF